MGRSLRRAQEQDTNCNKQTLNKMPKYKQLTVNPYLSSSRNKPCSNVAKIQLGSNAVTHMEEKKPAPSRPGMGATLTTTARPPTGGGLPALPPPRSRPSSLSTTATTTMKAGPARTRKSSSSKAKKVSATAFSGMNSKQSAILKAKLQEDIVQLRQAQLRQRRLLLCGKKKDSERHEVMEMQEKLKDSIAQSKRRLSGEMPAKDKENESYLQKQSVSSTSTDPTTNRLRKFGASHSKASVQKSNPTASETTPPTASALSSSSTDSVLAPITKSQTKRMTAAGDSTLSTSATVNVAPITTSTPKIATAGSSTLSTSATTAPLITTSKPKIASPGASTLSTSATTAPSIITSTLSTSATTAPLTSSGNRVSATDAPQTTPKIKMTTPGTNTATLPEEIDSPLRRSSRPTRCKRSLREDESDDKKEPSSEKKPEEKEDQDKSTSIHISDKDDCRDDVIETPPKKARTAKRQEETIKIGTVVYKHFDNFGWYWGKVSQVIYPDEDEDVNETIPYYQVVYEDGDCEDVGLEELQKCIEQATANKHKKDKSSASTKTKAGCGSKKSKPSGPKKKAGAKKNEKKPQIDEMEIDDLPTDLPEVTTLRRSSRSKRTIQEEDEEDTEYNMGEEDEKECKDETMEDQDNGKTNPRRVSVAADEEVSDNTETAPPRLIAAAARASSELENVTAILSEFQIDDKDDPKEKNNAEGVSYTGISYSFSESFWNALNSSSPHMGTHNMTRVLKHQHQIPNRSLWKNLVQLMTYGPKSDEGIFFPDRIRMDQAFDYIHLLLENLPASKEAELAELLCDTYWIDCLKQVSEPYYAAENDESRTNADALERIGQSVHAKACCIDTLRMLLESQAMECFAEKNIGLCLDLCKEKPILRDVLAQRLGARQGLELALSAYVSQWLLIGHFSDLESAQVDQNSGRVAGNDRLETLQLQSTRLLTSLGKVCSYMAWLYSLEAHEDARSVARIVSSHFFKQIEERGFDPPPAFLGETSNEEYWRSIKLQFVLGFDQTVIPQLRPALAENLGIAKTYNSCFGHDS